MPSSKPQPLGNFNSSVFEIPSRSVAITWLGKVGNERVIAVRASGMGPLGRGGSADLALRFCLATGATAIVQVGMAFGIAPGVQKLGDVLVSSSLIPYDNRDIKPSLSGESSRLARMVEPLSRSAEFLTRWRPRGAAQYPGRYLVDFTRANRQQASPSLVALFQREYTRTRFPFQVHFGALLSGAARIHARVFRNELVRAIPAGDDPIVGGEMEGVGLLGAADKPIWCVVKGIVDFADENRDAVFEQYRPIACHNAADFVLSALMNDAERDILQ
jgi:adenosylhomocysteine nucleosidase